MNQATDPSGSSAIAEKLFAVNLTQQQVANFKSKITVEEPLKCWEWNAGKNSDGYGVSYVVKRPYLAHRVAYFLAYGSFADRQRVCHSCDNPSCCNPKHLFLGSPADNSRDMVRKGRSTRGAKNAQTKLTAEQVLEIRQRYSVESISQRLLASQYGISCSHVFSIIARLRWQHL